MTLTKEDVVAAALRAVERGSGVDEMVKDAVRARFEAFAAWGQQGDLIALVGASQWADLVQANIEGMSVRRLAYGEELPPADMRLYRNRAARKRSRMRRRGGR